ncbi:hypothetical protein ACIRBY_31940 [Streptomyces sp. NPDC096136]|uniref:hypothetical protein n=1 Tax=Streptomyces sp. NPDC096136 TaxID=3366076 RepID=UPI00382E5312
MSSEVQSRGPKLPPTYPPKTPTPSKKPVEAPRPQPDTKPKTAVGLPSPRMTVRNRRTAGLTFRSDQWAPSKAAAQAVVTVRAWGYPLLDEGDLEAAVRALVAAAVADRGKRISVHLADQDQKILVVVLSHMPGLDEDLSVLADVAALRTVESCSTDAASDGRRLSVLLDAEPRPRRKSAA